MHGNSHENMNPYHLYAIDDIVEDDILKYGVTDDPIGDDGLPERVRIQVDLFNIVANFVRFVGRIVLSDIPGRAKAEEIENEYIDCYEKELGRRPRGNPRRKSKGTKDKK